jgi:hypothetical protein
MGIRIPVGKDADVLVFVVFLVFKEIECGYQRESKNLKLIKKYTTFAAIID